MSLLKSGSQPAGYVPRYTGLQIQTSSNAVPISIVYGTNRIAPNVIWTGGFFAISQFSKSGAGGKGGGGKQLSGYNYYTSFALGLCEGPIVGYSDVWSGQTRYPAVGGGFGARFGFGTSASVTALASAGLQFNALGTTPQTPWGALTTFHPTQALPYGGLAYVGAFNFQLGSSASLPQFAFEVKGALQTSSVVNGFDADPALIIQDLLTNAQYGVGFPAESIDATSLLGSSGDSSYQTYCQASSLAFSPALTNQEAASSILARWLQLTNTAAVWSGGKLKFISYGDTAITGATSNGLVTFNPNVSPIYNLTDDDFILEDGRDPVEVTRSDPYQNYNWQRLQISQRSNNYDATPVSAFDQNAIELYGLRMAPDITANEICDPNVGQIAAQLILQRQLYIRNQYAFKLSFEYCLLEPTDIVTLTDVDLGLNQAAVRIISIEEDDTGILAVTAEEFPGNNGTAVQYPVQTKSGNSTDQGVIPARINPPIIYEPPPSLTNGIPQVWIAVSGGVETAYKLSEDGSTGAHFLSQTMAPQASGTAVIFSIYARAVERSNCSLTIHDGIAQRSCGFDLAAAAASPGPAIISSSIRDADDGWYQLSIVANMAATATPILYVSLATSAGAFSYVGSAGSGIYAWGPAFAAGGQTPSFIPAFEPASGATITPNAVSTPEGAAGVADPNWGGAIVSISTDNVTFGPIGQINGPSRQGVLSAGLPAFGSANPDLAHILSVSLIESGGQLATATDSDAQNAITLCLVDKELIAYATATLTGTNAYDLTYLERGLHGTTVAAHPQGTPFARLDGAIFQYALPPALVGTTLYLKFQSFNIFGQAVQDISECATYTYTPFGSGTLGPVAQALSVGTNLDYGLASGSVNQTDDFGLASDPYSILIDLGLASA